MPRANPLTTHDCAGIAANIDVKTVGGVVIDSFESALHFLRSAPRGGSVDDRMLASNVMVSVHSYDEAMREPEAIDIILYRTPIVRYYRDGTFSVDNGGFNTPTTSRRVTQFTPAGYWAFHEKKQLKLNGHPTGHDRRFSIRREA